jgi:hypothetical protein
MLAPTLASPLALLHKLVRERHRAFHATSALHLADSLYNFCITSLALRDHLFVALAYTREQKSAFHKEWHAVPALVACSEIANTAKHGVLRVAPTTKGVELETSSWVDFSIDDAGDILLDEDVNHPDVAIVTSHDATLSIYDFTEAVVGFWNGFFFLKGLPSPDQSEQDLFGTSEG